MTTIARKIQTETSSRVLDAISFISNYQRNILDLFNQYDKSTAKKAITRKICNALMISMQIEEEIFYPDIRKVVKENGHLSAAIMGHSILKYLIAEIESLDEDSSVYDIKVSVLGEHVKELFMAKQTKLFPKIIALKKLDLWAIGAQLAWRKQELETLNNSAEMSRSYEV